MHTFLDLYKLINSNIDEPSNLLEKVSKKIQPHLKDKNNETKLICCFFLIKEVNQYDFYNLNPEILIEDFEEYVKEWSKKIMDNRQLFSKWLEALKIIEQMAGGGVSGGMAPNVTGAGVATDIPFRNLPKKIIKRKKVKI